MWPSEKQFADLLTKQKRRWEYPTKRFDLGNTYYRPDFYLPNEKLYIEVVGTRQAYHANKEKILKFKKLYPHIRFIIVDFKTGIPLQTYKRKLNLIYIPRIIKYFDSFIAHQPKHSCGKCGPKNWNSQICLTCYTIDLYIKRNKRFFSATQLLEYLISRKRI